MRWWLNDFAAAAGYGFGAALAEGFAAAGGILVRRRAMMLLRPWQRNDVAVRERDAVAAVGEGSCYGPGEGCIQQFRVGLIQQALFIVCVCVLPTKCS